MERRSYEAQADSGAYQTEHWMAWLMAVVAIVMGAIGLLVGFDVLDLRDDLTGGAGERAARDFDEGLLWLLPAVAASLLAMTLHNTDHHRAPRTRSSAATEDDRESGLYKLEHGAAYLVALAAIVAGALALLVGYDVFDNNNTERDGQLWAWTAIFTSVLAYTLHSVRHHQMVAEEDVIVRIIEERTGGMPAAAATRERATERRPDTPRNP